ARHIECRAASASGSSRGHILFGIVHTQRNMMWRIVLNVPGGQTMKKLAFILLSAAVLIGTAGGSSGPWDGGGGAPFWPWWGRRPCIGAVVRRRLLLWGSRPVLW